MDSKFGLCVIVTDSFPFGHSKSVVFYDLSEINLHDAVHIMLRQNADFFDDSCTCEMTLTVCFGNSVLGRITPEMSSLLLCATHSGNKVDVERDLLGIKLF